MVTKKIKINIIRDVKNEICHKLIYSPLNLVMRLDDDVIFSVSKFPSLILNFI